MHGMSEVGGEDDEEAKEDELWLLLCSKMSLSRSSRQVVVSYVDSATMSPLSETRAALADPVPLVRGKVVSGRLAVWGLRQ